MRVLRLIPLFAVITLSILAPSDAMAAATINQLNHTFSSDNLQYEIIKPATKAQAGQVAVTGTIDKKTEIITIPESIQDSSYTYTVSEIGNYAFSNLDNLTHINIPSSVTVMGSYVFYDCDQLESVTLPDSIKRIGRSLFLSCDSLKNVHLPKGLVEIGDSTFYNCISLEQVNIPVKLSYIPENTFSGCQSLQEINLPYGISFIGKYAFTGCSSLTAISIPNSVTGIGVSAFKACSSLRYINLSNKLLYLSDYMLADCSSLETVYLPDKLESIGSGVFSGCQKLTGINIPDTVASIGTNAFYNCVSLEQIKLSDSLIKISEGAFKNCSDIKAITLPEKLEALEGNAFENCSSLSEIAFNSRLTHIGAYAFANCSSLASVQLPDSLISIGKQAFKGCTALSKLSLSPNIVDISSDIISDTAIPSVYKNGLLILDGYLLDGSKAGGSLVIPDSVHCIASAAFKNNTELTAVRIPNTVTVIGSNAFYGCNLLERVQLPDSLTVMAKGIFYDCVKLSSINLPKKLTEISSDCFSNCSSLQSVTLPDSLTQIGHRAFYKCSSLTKITFPANLSVIGSSAFSECASLTEVKIPGSVGWVGNFAFSSCSSLIYVKAGARIISNYAFEDCSSLTEVILTDKVLNLGAYAFRNCNSLRAVTLSDNLTVIDYFTFAGCTNLSGLNIPDNLEYILHGAFNDCRSLKSISLPKNTFVDETAFSGCDVKINFMSANPRINAVIDDKASYDNLPCYPGYVAQVGEQIYYLSGAPSYETDIDSGFQIKTADNNIIGKVNSSFGFIYYKDQIYHIDYNRSLYRLSLSDSKQIRLMKKVDIPVAIYQDYIYYIKDMALYRADINGKNPVMLAVLSNESISPYYRSQAIRFYGNSIYYVTCNMQNWLFSIEKMNLDGTGHKILAGNLPLKDLNYNIYLAGEQIFYQTEDNRIHSIDENGNYGSYGQGIIHGVINDELYYTNEGGLWRLSHDSSKQSTDTTTELVLAAKYIPADSSLADISADGKTIAFYYLGDDDSERGYLYLINTEDYSLSIIAEDDTVWPGRLIGNYIYYHKDYNYENGPISYLRTRYK